MAFGADGWDPLLGRLGEDSLIMENYQFWNFLYRTDRSYLASANDLRASLNDALDRLDRKRANPRLANIVLIGHGMGGLLSKLQVAHSDQHVWNAVSEPAPR